MIVGWDGKWEANRSGGACLCEKWRVVANLDNFSGGVRLVKGCRGLVL